jgi:hypothetical protein
MIKPLNAPQLSSMKSRCGLQKVSELLPRLIQQYEMQAEMMKRINQPSSATSAMPVPALPVHDAPVEQATFGWYE